MPLARIVFRQFVAGKLAGTDSLAGNLALLQFFPSLGIEPATLGFPLELSVPEPKQIAMHLTYF